MKSKQTHLTPELTKEIVELAIDAYRKEADRRRKAAFDKRLHNTKILMEKYRAFVIHSQSAVHEASQVEDDLDFDNLIELMSSGDAKGLSVDSVRESTVRTSIMVHHIDKMIGYYEYCCKQSKKPEDARRLRVIKALYIDEDKKTPEELAEQEFVDVRTIYRDQKAALQQLSALIFGYFE